MISRAKIQVFFLFFSIFSYPIVAQTTVHKNDVDKIIKDSKKALMELNTKKSVLLAQKGLSGAFQLNDNNLKAKAYMVLGCNFVEFADTNKAKEYFFKSIHFANLSNNDTIKESVYNNIGALYSYYENNFSKGMYYYKKGMYYTERIKNPTQLVYNSLNMAGAYVDKGMFKDALPYLKKAKRYIHYTNEKEAWLTYSALEGRYYSYIGNPTKAVFFFNKALYYGKSDTTSLLESYLAEVYADFAIHYENYNDYKKALKYSRLSSVLKEKVYNTSRSEIVKESEDKIKIKEYENHISYIERVKKEKELNLSKTYIIIGLFILVSIVLGILVYVLQKNNKARKRSYDRLENINNALEKAKLVAEESTRLKTQFVSTITHELRTPLYAVIGISDLLSREYPEIEKSEYLKSLKFSAQYLLALVNDVLQIHKISENKIVLEKSSFEIKEIIEAIKNSFYTQSIKTKNLLILDIDPQLPKKVLGDSLRLSQILMNLISNALKFTSNGEVYIRVKKNKELPNKINILFIVEDNGIGIAPENLERVFDEFVQIERREEDYQGTGLGLPIVKKLITLFNGEIHIESQLNKGTKIIFNLWFEQDTSYLWSKPLAQTKNENKPTQKLKILLAEDNKINQIITKKVLNSFGYDVVVVDDGFQTIQECKNQTFDIIFMDINMPYYDGYETTQILRGLGIITPIIALTAYDKQEVLGQCKKAGMDNIIVKPFQKEHLLDLIKQYINNHKLTAKE